MTRKASRQAGHRSIPRLAVVGCGAAAREFCLPLLAKYPDYRRSIVAVDKNQQQASRIAQEFGIEHACTDFQSLPFEVSAAIVMTPHQFHAEQSIYFLRQGKPVFVEKPLGISAKEVTEMLAAAEEGGATLMVNNCRRLFPSYRRVKQLLESGELGSIRKIRITDGSPFDWGSVSGFYMRDAQQARGVFLDRGAHTVDIVNWWLGVQPRIRDSLSDAMGGAEALMKLQLTKANTEVALVFSRLYKLENRYDIECEKGAVGGRLFDANRLEVVRGGKVESIQAGQPRLYHEHVWHLLENFIDVVNDVAAPQFTAADVAPSIELIDEAYRVAKAVDLPWYRDDPNIAHLRHHGAIQTK